MECKNYINIIYNGGCNLEGGRRRRRSCKVKKSHKVKHHKKSTRKGMRRKTARRAYMKGGYKCPYS